MKRILLITAGVIVLGILAVFLIPRDMPDIRLDNIVVSDIVNSISNNWEEIQNKADIPVFDYNLDYVIIHNDGNLITATRNGLNENINDAIRNRDTIVDIEVNGEIVGKIIFYNNTGMLWQQFRTGLIRVIIIILMLLMAVCMGYTFYLNHTVLRPFSKLQAFAKSIAMGNLDAPLEMDQNNLFGAFTESFDLMREELSKARENERNANQSKKELVASLSHDIKTPVASIKAVTELLLLKTQDKNVENQLIIINLKAEQINSLITNMFHATLEELQALPVNVAEIPSTAIPDIIRNADYENRVTHFSIPSCIILVDMLRLQQVFDNIIGNSYKYAGTDIEIQANFEEHFLKLDIKDFGAGVTEEELPLLFQKFFRSKNADTKGGYGLGLYISKYLIEQMNGNIECINCTDGFTIRLMLHLA